MSCKLKWLVIGILCLPLASCSGLPEDLKKIAATCPDQLQRKQESLSQARNTFVALQATDEYKTFLKRYSDREEWETAFSTAQQELDAATALYNEDIKVLVESDKPDNKQKLTDNLGSFTQHLKKCGDAVDGNSKRIEQLRKARQQGPEMVKQATTQIDSSKMTLESIERAGKSAQESYPGKKADIAKRLAPINGHHKDAEAKLADVQKQMAASDPDYAVVIDDCNVIATHTSEVEKLAGDLKKKLNELGRSYSKILTDMRAEFFAVVQRTSWDENSDWDTEHDYTYNPRPISADSYAYFGQFADDTLLATSSAGFFGGKNITVSVDQSEWEKLQVATNESWPSGDNSAEYSLGDVYGKFSHQYTIEENGKTSVVWQEVSEDVFEDSIDDLGMALVTKPVGVYEEEALKQATPPGFAYAGNPHYGQWKKDASGNSFWEFYGQYHFYRSLFGYQPYYQSEWSDWNRNYRGREAYYGPASSPTRYGSESKSAQTHFAGSTHAKQGGFKSGFSSVRGAGPSARGGGPGGGGK